MSVFSCGVQGGGGLSPPVTLTSFESDSASVANNINVLYDASGSNRLLVSIVGVRGSSVASTSSVTFNGVSGTIAESGATVAGVATSSVLVYWLDSELPSSNGTYAIDHNFSGTPDEGFSACWMFENVNQTTPLSFSDVLVGTQWLSGTSKSITNTADEGHFAGSGIIYNDNDSGYTINQNTIPTGLTERYDVIHPDQNRFAHNGADTDAKSSNSDTYTWTNNSGQGYDSWQLYSFAINPLS